MVQGGVAAHSEADSSDGESSELDSVVEFEAHAAPQERHRARGRTLHPSSRPNSRMYTSFFPYRTVQGCKEQCCLLPASVSPRIHSSFRDDADCCFSSALACAVCVALLVLR
jgi:hypothetical protein